MCNYIRADLRNVYRRLSHIILFLILYGVFALMLIIPNLNVQVNSVVLAAQAASTVKNIISFFGLFELIAIFGEDFKAKSIQAAVGLGLSRAKVVLSKIIELIIKLMVDCVILVAVTLGVGAYFSLSIPLEALMDLFIALAMWGILANVSFAALTMPVLFTSQSTLLSTFVYLAFSIGIVTGLLSLTSLLGLEWLDKLQLERFMLTHLLGVTESRMVLGNVDIPALLGCLAYPVAGLILTIKLFEKRELDF